MKYLLLKHDRGGPAPIKDCGSMDHWTPEEVDAHVQYMVDFAARLRETGEFVDAQARRPARRPRRVERAADLHAEAALAATSVPERDHLTRSAARVRQLSGRP